MMHRGGVSTTLHPSVTRGHDGYVKFIDQILAEKHVGNVKQCLRKRWRGGGFGEGTMTEIIRNYQRNYCLVQRLWRWEWRRLLQMIRSPSPNENKAEGRERENNNLLQ